MEPFTYAPPDTPLQIVHIDDALIVVEKPTGLLTVPGRGEDRADCLITRLRTVHPDALLVHRLDLDTSGLVLFARTAAVQASLGRLFEARDVKKRYIARVWGRPERDKGRINLPLIVDWPNRPRQHVDHETGRPAVTEWRVVDRGATETRVRLMPQTGRSHQLRVHMAEIGHPILGDPLYAEGPARDFPRLMLHAEGLKFAHPDGTGTAEFTSPCPF